MTGKPGPLQGDVAFLDPLLGGSPFVVKSNHTLGLPTQIGSDKSDFGKQFLILPFNLGNYKANFITVLTLIHKRFVKHLWLEK